MAKNHPQLKIYFENLGGVRFIAALLVIVHHTEKYKSIFNLENCWENTTIELLGRLGVLLFFVLSGFLISFLLLKEEEYEGQISIKNFYVRRVLRIWPLYFLIILCSFFLFPFINLFTIEGAEKEIVWQHISLKLILYALFLPNVVSNLFVVSPYASQTWTIGSEEQFYLIWPLFFRKFKNKFKLIALFILIYLAVKLLLYLLAGNKYLAIAYGLWASAPLDCMAIGGLFALLIYEKSRIAIKLCELLYAKKVQLITLFSIILLMFSSLHLPNELYCVLFGILICNLAANKNSLFSLENPVLNYLGKISYGLYMFHQIAIVLCIKFLKNCEIDSNYILYPLILLTTIAISALSYEFFEKFFIKKKISYSKILSGNSP